MDIRFYGFYTEDMKGIFINNEYKYFFQLNNRELEIVKNYFEENHYPLPYELKKEIHYRKLLQILI